MASRYFVRSAILATRLTTQLPRIVNLQQLQKCSTTPLTYQIKTLWTTARRAVGAFECINIQDKADFKSKVIQSNIPVIVDFHASWCGPCKVLGPRLEAIISEKKGKVVLAKVDIDENPELAMEYEVRSVPMVMSVKDGEVHDSFIGVKDDDVLKGFVSSLL